MSTTPSQRAYLRPFSAHPEGLRPTEQPEVGFDGDEDGALRVIRVFAHEEGAAGVGGEVDRALPPIEGVEGEGLGEVAQGDDGAAVAPGQLDQGSKGRSS